MLYYFIQEQKYNTKIFWFILLAITTATSILAYLLSDVEGSRFFWAFPFATYTNVGIIAFQSVKKDIPFGLKMGAIRKNIYLSYMYFFFGYAVFMAVLSSTVQSMFEGAFQVFGITNYIFAHPAMLLTDTWFMRIVVDTFAMFFLMAFLFLVGLLFYQTGKLGGGIFLGVLVVISLYGSFDGWLLEGFAEIFAEASLLTFAILFFIGVGLYLICYPFIQRMTIVKRV